MVYCFLALAKPVIFGEFQNPDIEVKNTDFLKNQSMGKVTNLVDKKISSVKLVRYCIKSHQ